MTTTTTPPLTRANRPAAWAVAAWLAIGVVANVASAESLAEAWNAALAENQRLAASRLRVTAAESRVGAAAAERWPTLTARGGYHVLSAEPAFQVSAPAPFSSPLRWPYSQDEGASLAMNARAPLYAGGAITAGIESAEARAAHARSVAQREVLDLKLAVATAYVDVLRSRREVDAAGGHVRSLDAHGRDAARMFERQLAKRADVLAAEVALAHARQREIQAQTHSDVARASYNRLLGRPLTAPVQLDELTCSPNASELDALTAAALRQRPEIAELSAQSRTLRREAAIVDAGRRPRVDLLGTLGYEENRFQAFETIGELGVVCEWTGFDAGRRTLEATAIRHEADAATRMLADAQTMIALEVRREYLALDEAGRRHAVARQTLARADENLRVAKERYQAGLGTNTEVLDAETLRLQSVRDLYHSACDAVLATLRLRRAVGEL